MRLETIPTLIGLFLFLAACRPIETPAPFETLKPDISITYTTYQITGTTAAELRAQMDQRGPAGSFNRHDAYTGWEVTYSYPYAKVNNACDTGPVTVKVAVTFLFPAWEIPPDVSPALVDQWASYLNALKTHEEGHKEIALAAGHEILSSLNDLPASPSCDQLEQAADITAQAILAKFRQQELIYDQDTDHGASQGARFP